MAEKLVWGIMGTGGIAHAFAKAVGESDSGTLVAVGSRSQATADKFGDEFGVPHRHATYDALLADAAVQAIYISTPHPMHIEWIIKCAEAGKHILCEKPLTLNYPDAMAAAEAARRNGIFLMEAFMWRCHPLAARLAKVISSGEIGKVHLIRAPFSFHGAYDLQGRWLKRELGGGGILDVGCYTTSMVRLVAGAALGTGIAEPIEFKGHGHLGTESGTDEYAGALLRFDNDIFALLSCGVQMNEDNTVRIYGSKGSITIPSAWFWSPPKFTVSLNNGESRDETDDSGKTVYAYEADAFAAGVAAGQAPYPAMSVADTLGNMAALDRWRRDIGLLYDEEKPGAERPTLDRAPLRRRPLKAGGNAMKYARVAGVEKDISRLVMGSMLEGNILPVPHAHALFDSFFEFGGNCFDTARVYGSEHIFGQWLANRGVREEIALIVKGAHPPADSPAGLTRELLESLDKLQTGYADIYMMHRDNTAIPAGEYIEELNAHVQGGRIRAFGGSNWSLARVDEANVYAKAKGLQGFAVVSNNFSLARMVDPVWSNCIAASDPDSRRWFTASQTALFAWSSQARGFFVRGRRDFHGDEELERCWYSDDNFERLARVQKLAAQRHTLPTNIALAYVLAQPFPTFALVGPRSVEEIRTTLPGLDVQLADAELKWLNLED